MKLRLYHGRNSPDERMDDWGFDGPILEFEWICITYLTTFRIGFKDRAQSLKARELTCWEEWDEGNFSLEMNQYEGLIVADGKFYGDWEIFNDEEKQA